MSADGGAAVMDGALYLLQQPMALAVLAALFLVTRDLPMRGRAWALAGLASGAGLTLAIAPAAWQAVFAAACVAALGGAGAVGVRASKRWARPACLVGGLAVGFSAGLPIATGAEALGTVALACILLLMLHTGWQLAAARWGSGPAWQVAPRVVAAWLAAIGLLMLALTLKSWNNL